MTSIKMTIKKRTFWTKKCLQPLEILDFLSMTSILQAHNGGAEGS